jgi:DNA repair exonuclease SbcCD nuclease subunit
VTWLITSDTHLTDRPRDSYRFGLFRWLAQQQEKHQVTETFLLGDITDRKDNHSSNLVNRIVDELTLLKPPIYILRGNHDCIDPTNPFFKFLNCIDGVEFLSEPKLLKHLGVAMIPHQADQALFDAACRIIPPKPAAVMVHACLNGAIAETGTALAGISGAVVAALKPARWYAGDIHRPQTLDCGATYVGSPYQVRFGDDFTPRVLLLKNNEEKDLHFPCLRKWSLTIRSVEDLTLNSPELRTGDQVKIVVELAREEAVEWSMHRQRVLAACKELKLEVFGLDLEVKTNTQKRVKLDQTKGSKPEDILKAFCESENVAGNIKQTGLELLK